MKSRLIAASIAVICSTIATAQTSPRIDETAWFQATYKELVEINTTYSVGNTTEAAKAAQKRLIEAGFPPNDVEVIEPFPKRGNLLARYKGTSTKKPLLLLAHLDVVEAKPSEWKTDPFKLVEQDGYYIARGAIDDKAMASSYISVLAQMRREGFVPDRDIVVALTADEERDVPSNGAAWLLKNRRTDVDAEYGINEGGRGELKNGKPLVHVVQIGEKTYLDFAFEASGPGGHSARPTPDNTIYDLAEALARLRQYRFPVQLSDATRAYFERTAPLQDAATALDFKEIATGKPSPGAIDRLSKRSAIIGLLRTTCVATMLEGGHAPNALAQRAKATINCRALPGENVATVRSRLEEIAGPRVKVSDVEIGESAPASPMNPGLMGRVDKISEAMWPGVPVVPTMGVSTTDSRLFRAAGIPMYGVSGLFVDPEQTGIHGLNEKIGMRQLLDGREFMYRLIKSLSSDGD